MLKKSHTYATKFKSPSKGFHLPLLQSWSLYFCLYSTYINIYLKTSAHIYTKQYLSKSNTHLIMCKKLN